MVVSGESGPGTAKLLVVDVLEMPAPVVADALGYHQVTAARLAAQAGNTWSHYAPGDHSRSPSSRSTQGTRDS